MAALPTASKQGYPFAAYLTVPQPFQQHGFTYISNTSAFSMWLGDLLFQVCNSPNDMVNFKSVVGIKPGDSGVVIRYKVEEYTHMWLVECFIAS